MLVSVLLIWFDNNLDIIVTLEKKNKLMYLQIVEFNCQSV